MVGKDIAEKYNIVNHNARDTKNCSQIGKTKTGIPIILNKIFLDSDFKIITGLIEPHFRQDFQAGESPYARG